MRDSLKIFYMAVVAITLGFIAICPLNTLAQEMPVEIIEIDIYEKTIGPEETVTYNWTLRNTHTSSNYTVEMYKSESVSGWTTNFNQDILKLLPQSIWNVTLSVKPPVDMTKGELTVNINFKITNETGGWNVTLPAVFTKVYVTPKVLNLFDNPLPAPLNNKYGVFILDVIIWSLIVVVVYFISERIIRHWTKRTKTQLDDIIFKIIRGPILVLLILFGFVSSVEVLDLPRNIVEYVNLGYLITLIFLITWLAYRLFKDILIYYGRIYSERTKTEIDDVLIPVAEKVGAVIIFVVAIAVILAYVGVDLTMLAVGSIVISMVIAFALQDTLSNFFSGLYILTDRPFKVGDLVLLESGEVCKIEHIGMRSTRLYNTFEHTMIVLPNNRLANDKVINYTEPDTQFRITVKVGVAYGTDPEKIFRILYEIADAHPKVLKDIDKFKPSVRFTQFGDSSLNFELWVWIDHVQNRFEVKSDIHMEINRRFKEEGVTIPFPQRTIWSHNIENSHS